MSASRFEIVRTDAGWHARFISNARIIFASENYTRMVGAERAVLAFANAGAASRWSLRWNVVGVEKVFWNDAFERVPRVAPLVKYVDERGTR